MYTDLSFLIRRTQVKRIVMTSSVGAIIRLNIPQGFIFDESYWGDEFLQAVKDQGSAAPEMVKYRASKVLSERGGLLIKNWYCYSAMASLQLLGTFITNTKL